MKYEQKEEKVEGGREGKKVVVDGGVTHIDWEGSPRPETADADARRSI